MTDTFAARVQAARAAYAALGLLTTPLRPRAKAPFAAGWQDGRGWDAAPADANVGIVTGAPSGGLVVLDVDALDVFKRVFPCGVRALARVAPVVRTARGFHVWTRAVGVGCSKLAPSVDVKGEGGLVVAPPSRHPSGAEYFFMGPVREPAPLERVLQLARLDAARLDDAPRAQAPAPRAADPAVAGGELAELAAWMATQPPALRAHWHGLLVGGAGDRSRSEYVVALAFLERGDTPGDVARTLRTLPHGKAREREDGYAARTVEEAQRALRARGPAPRTLVDSGRKGRMVDR